MEKNHDAARRRGRPARVAESRRVVMNAARRLGRW